MVLSGPPECDLDVYPWSFRNPYNGNSAKEKENTCFVLTAILVTIAGGLLGTLTMVDYYGIGVLTVFIFTFSADANGGVCLVKLLLFIG